MTACKHCGSTKTIPDERDWIFCFACFNTSYVGEIFIDTRVRSPFKGMTRKGIQEKVNGT